MDAEKDAYGHVIKDYFETGEGEEIIERDDGHIGSTGGPETYFAPYPEWRIHVQDAMEYVHGNVLDIGCGAGRHILYLQNQGFTVTGIDVAPRAIEVCEKRGLDDVHVLGIDDVDDLNQSFDTVLMLGNNFGLVESREKAGEHLARLARITSEDARIIAESKNPHDTGDEAHLQYQEENETEGYLPGRIRMRARYGTYCTDWFNYLMVSPEEMRSLLEDTAWEQVEVIEGEDGMYIAVLRKE